MDRHRTPGHSRVTDVGSCRFDCCVVSLRAAVAEGGAVTAVWASAVLVVMGVGPDGVDAAGTVTAGAATSGEHAATTVSRTPDTRRPAWCHR